MKKNTSSLRFHTIIIISSLLLLELSYHSLLFAATGSITHTPIIDNASAVKITHGPRIQSTAEGEEVIENANGTLIN
jgi:hypothetical protein